MNISIKNVENQAVTVALLPFHNRMWVVGQHFPTAVGVSVTQFWLKPTWHHGAAPSTHVLHSIQALEWSHLLSLSESIGIQMHKWHHSPWHKPWNSDGHSWVFQRMSCWCLGVKTWWRLMIAIFADSWLPFETFQDTPTYLGLNVFRRTRRTSTTTCNQKGFWRTLQVSPIPTGLKHDEIPPYPTHLSRFVRDFHGSIQTTQQTSNRKSSFNSIASHFPGLCAYTNGTYTPLHTNRGDMWWFPISVWRIQEFRGVL